MQYKPENRTTRKLTRRPCSSWRKAQPSDTSSLAAEADACRLALPRWPQSTAENWKMSKTLSHWQHIITTSSSSAAAVADTLTMTND